MAQSEEGVGTGVTCLLEGGLDPVAADVDAFGSRLRESLGVNKRTYYKILTANFL